MSGTKDGPRALPTLPQLDAHDGDSLMSTKFPLCFIDEASPWEPHTTPPPPHPPPPPPPCFTSPSAARLSGLYRRMGIISRAHNWLGQAALIKTNVISLLIIVPVVPLVWLHVPGGNNTTRINAPNSAWGCKVKAETLPIPRRIYLLFFFIYNSPALYRRNNNCKIALSYRATSKSFRQICQGT